MSTMTTARAPRGHPLLGHIPALRRDALGFFVHCAREWGDLVPLRFGRRPGLLVSSPAAIDEILVAGVKNFIKSPAYQNMRVAMGNGLLVNEGELWLHQRRMIQPAFHRNAIAALTGGITDHTDRLLERWQDGGVRDVHADLHHAMLGIIITTLVGNDLADQASVAEAALGDVVNGLSAYFRRLPLPRFVPTPSHFRLRRAVRQLDDLLYHLIARRRSSGGTGDDMLGMLMQARDEHGGGMTDRQLRDELVVLGLAGHETTALGLAYALDCLARHPAVVASLEAELETVLDGRTPTASDVPRLRYTEMVALETMRLFPPVCAMGRQAVRDCTVAGVPVRAGTVLLMPQWAVHRDPRFYDEPDRFLPERWADGLIRRLPRFAYFPFGAGQRRCIGDGLAMLEMVLGIAMAAQRYRFEASGDQAVAVDPSGTLRPRHGVWLVVSRK